jgi:hypothetical protein
MPKRNQIRKAVWPQRARVTDTDTDTDRQTDRITMTIGPLIYFVYSVDPMMMMMMTFQITVHLLSSSFAAHFKGSSSTCSGAYSIILCLINYSVH